MFQNKNGFSLRNSHFVVYLIAQLASIAVLHNYNLEPFIFVHIEAFDYIFAVADHHELGFSLAESPFNLFDSFVGFFFDSEEVEYLDCDCLFGGVVHAFVDGPEGSSA